MDRLPIEKTKGIVSFERFRMVLFGAPKIGKTTLCSGFPDTIFLVTEKNHNAFKIYAQDISNWAEFKKVVKLLTTTEHQFKNIVIDTGDILFNHCVTYVCAKLNIEHPTEAKWGKAYDLIGREFEREINKLFMTDYGLIILSHTKQADIVGKGTTFTKIVPTLPNKARAIILPKVPVIGYMYTKRVKLSDGNKTERRVISFEPSEFIEAGNSDELLPPELIVPKNPRQAYELFESYYLGKRIKK